MLAKLPALLALPLALLATTSAWQHMHSNLLFAQLEVELTFWGQERYHPTGATRERTGNGTKHLTNTAPHNPDYWTLRAGQQAWEAWWSESDEAAMAHNGAAADAQWQALQYRPAHGQSWQMMLEYAQRAPSHGVKMKEAQQRLEGLALYKREAP